jgi:LacI family transcriptional regulator
MASKKPTMRDIGRVAGVSVYTVSKALSGIDGVSAASRERVLRAARELGYVPNRAAQELRKNTRSAVAVITASTSNYYYIDMMRGIERVLRASGRTAVVADIAAEGAYSLEWERRTVQDLLRSRAAGVIATFTLSAENTQLFEDWDIPVVFVDSAPPPSATRVPSITTDNYSASTKVGDHLAGHGYPDWLFLVYPALWSSRAERERGLREAAQRHGATLRVLESDNDRESAYTTLGRYLDAPGVDVPRALIAGNNPMVHGALRAFADRGLAVPRDVAVIAYDEFPWAGLLAPPLTVLDEDSENIGSLAAQILTRLIDEQVDAERQGLPPTPAYRPDDRRVLGAELIVRRSCGC